MNGLTCLTVDPALILTLDLYHDGRDLIRSIDLRLRVSGEAVGIFLTTIARPKIIPTRMTTPIQPGRLGKWIQYHWQPQLQSFLANLFLSRSQRQLAGLVRLGWVCS